MSEQSLRDKLRDNVQELWRIADAAEGAGNVFASNVVISDAYDDLAVSFNSAANELDSYLSSRVFSYADWELRNVAEQLEKRLQRSLRLFNETTQAKS